MNEMGVNVDSFDTIVSHPDLSVLMKLPIDPHHVYYDDKKIPP